MTEASRPLFLFLIAGATQARDLSSLLPRLDTADVRALLVSDGRIVPVEPDFAPPAGHAPRPTAGGIGAAELSLRRLAREAPAAAVTVVSGQDIGTVQRRALALAAAWGWRRVLVPDGVVFHPAQGRDQPTRSLRGALRRAAQSAGQLAGNGVSIGASNPDVICSWGPGWADYWGQHAATSRVEVTGSPRADVLAAVPPPAAAGNVLVCSQPLSHLGGGGDITQRWYRWLGEAAQDLGSRFRLRLHPQEHEAAATAGLHEDLSSKVSTDTLDADLAWSDSIVTACSTVALEALTVGRHAALVEATETVVDMWTRSPFFANFPSSARLTLNAPLREQMPALALPMAWGSDYLACVGGAADRVAEVLLEQ